MAKFKVGDVVRYIGRSGLAYAGDQHLIIVGVHQSHYEYRYPNGTLQTILNYYAEQSRGDWEMILVPRAGENNKTMEKPMTEEMYHFNVSSPDSIDLMEIQKDLTRSNPIAKVTFKGDKGTLKHYVIVHDSLMDKANTLFIADPTGDYYSPYAELSHPSEYAVWMDWAKRVITAEWENKERGVVTVTPMKVRV